MPPARVLGPHREDEGRRGGVTRPWDRPGGISRTRRAAKRRLEGEIDPAALAFDGGIDDEKRGRSSVPFVVVGGVAYYSDRFYLTSSEYDDVHPQQLERGSALGSAELECRHCGSNRRNNDNESMRSQVSDRQSDLLDVSRLVASLDLKAAVLATFSLDTTWFLGNFPSLAHHVPTLVLHGQRGSSDVTLSDMNNAQNGVDPRREPNSKLDDDEEDADSVDSMDSEELYTQPEETLAYVRAVMEANGDGGDVEGVGTASECSRKGLAVSPYLYFTKVITKWVPTVTGVGKHTGEFKAGVHHPKFLLLFEKSGSLVVVVTTANLTPRRTIDGVWVQRFDAAAKSAVSSSASTHGESTTADVGRVLQNLLTAQTHAIQIHAKNRDGIPMTPHAFLRKHLSWEGLDAIMTSFDYTKSQVHLVATVPGTFSTPEYGRQRVSHILKQLSSCPSDANHQQGIRRPRLPWLPPTMLTDNDRLVIQPTSFGEWAEACLAKVVNSYLGTSEGAGNSPLERLDIVWPTEKFVQSVRSHLKSLKSVMASALPLQDSALNQPLCRYGLGQRPPIAKLPSAATRLACPTEGTCSSQPSMSPVPGKVRPAGIPRERRTRGGYMFLSSSTFNRIDEACLSRMVQWEPCHPVPTSKRPTLVSHLKTIARVVSQESNSTQSASRQPWYQTRGLEANNVFSWVMMTSACLSRGAQGDTAESVTSSKGDHSVSYSNFELGVMFCSRLQHKPTDRVYCWTERRCACKANPKERDATVTGTSRNAHHHRATMADGPRMIPLPFPYRLDAAKYQQCEDEVEFAETPYFHEITPSDCHVGNMRMTPFGDYVAQKLGDE